MAKEKGRTTTAAEGAVSQEQASVALAEPTSPASAPGELNFDAAPGIEARSSPEKAYENRVHEATASGLSVIIAFAVLLASVGAGRFLSARNANAQTRIAPPPGGAKFAKSWHALSLTVASFLGLNVLFGGLTAFLLNGVPEDAQAYFSEISALKLARLSHEHFFGYAVLFGLITALTMFFVGSGRKRVLIPAAASFAFSALDAASWWLSRYVSTGFHTLSFLTGGAFALSFLALYVQLARVNIKAILGKRNE